MIEKYILELKRIFSKAKNKHDAHYQSIQVLKDIAGDRSFLTEVIRRHISKTENLNTLHYPVVAMEIDLNEHFSLVANCWIPLPDKDTNVSTKSIHHHGDMLLTTITAFGAGYEHWTFKTPSVVDADREIYELKILDQAPHPLYHSDFVDSWVAHLPFYPPDMTVTFALWSSKFQTSWKDKLKRVPVLRDNSKKLKNLLTKAGLAKKLELKVVEYYDFYPTSEGFRGMRERKEFERSNNEDYLASLFHIIQETGNHHLSKVLRESAYGNAKVNNLELFERYLVSLEKGDYIEGKLSEKHFSIDYANFTKEQILESIQVQNKIA